MVKLLGKTLGVSVLIYILAIFLSSREVIIDYKNFPLIFLGSCVWVYLYANSAKLSHHFFICCAACFCAMFAVPFLGFVTEPLHMRRLVKDLLFYYSFVPLLICLAVIWRKQSIIYVNTMLYALMILPLSYLWGYYFLVGGKLSTSTVLAIMKTNRAEAWEFVVAYLGWAGCLGISICLGLIFYVAYLLAKKTSLAAQNISLRLPVALGLAVLLVVGCKTYGSKALLPRVFKEAQSIQNSTMEFQEQANNRLALINEADHSKMHMTANDSFALVISESHTRTHMSAYGYNRETTPYLNKAVAEGQVFLAKNAFSCAAITYMVMDYALTERTQYNNIADATATNIVEMAKHAGYRVVWISNQHKDTLAGYLADEADEVYWVNSNNSDSYMLQRDNSVDLNVNKKLASLAKPEQKTLYVLHLLGCHSNYICRYPQEFNKWEDNNAYTNSTNAYDNSVLYNDFVMEKIRYTLFDKLGVSSMLFFADHGEEVESTFRHGNDFFVQNYKKGKNFHEIVQVPMYLAVSPSFKAAHSKLIKAWQGHEQDYFTNDMIYDTLLGLMNIKCQRYEEKNDFTSGKYQHELTELKTIGGKLRIADCM